MSMGDININFLKYNEHANTEDYPYTVPGPNLDTEMSVEFSVAF